MLKRKKSLFLVSEDGGKIIGFQYGFIDYYRVDKKKEIVWPFGYFSGF